MSQLEQHEAEHWFNQVWARTRAILRAEMDRPRFNQFIAPLGVVSAEPEHVVLSCRTPEARDRTVDRFGARIADLLALSLPRLTCVDFVVDPTRPPVALVPPRAAIEPPLVPAPPRPPHGGGSTPPGGSGAPIKIERIKRRVAEHFSITVQDLESASRKRGLVWPRQLAMALSRRLTPQTFPQIARRFGSRDHTTVMYGCEKVRQLSECDPAVAAELDLLAQAICADVGDSKNTPDPNV